MTDTVVEPGPIVEEVRFAVVMYGGISLCVYMNGIMQQLLHLVRATATDPATATDAAPDGEFVVPDDAAMPPIERVYRRLAQARSHDAEGRVTCKFIVDVLSGTSAGGLNNLFLARALANEEDVDELTRLWIKEGDIASLFNDARSEDPRWGVVATRPPESLLNGSRMAQRLLQAMRGMEKTGRSKGRASRLVRRLDLHMTATDLEGLDQSLHIGSDQSITEMRHRASFHFVHDPDNVGYLPDQGAFRNDFDPRMTPFLTFVSRATSSIVPAFEPVRLDDVARLVDRGDPAARYDPETSPLQYSPFFRDFWSNAKLLQIENPAVRRKKAERAKKDFVYHAFGDGGYGDNYPFGYAIDEVARRQNDVLVDRKFLYVEPDPTSPPPESNARGVPPRPDVVAHLKAMNVVKSTETIRDDIARLREHNRLQERVGSVRLASEEAEVAAGEAASRDAAPGYLRVRASATTDELAVVFANALGFEEDTPYRDAIRAMVKAIRLHVFGDAGGGYPNFLDAFDLATLRRWVRFEQRTIAAEGKVGVSKDTLRALSEIGSELRRVPVLLEVAAAQAQGGEPGEARPPSDAERQTTAPNALRSQALMGYFSRERLGIPQAMRAVSDTPPADVERPVAAFLEALADLGSELPGLPGRHITVAALAALVVEHPVHWTGVEKPDHPADEGRIEAAWRLLTGVAPQGPEEDAAAFAKRAAEDGEAGRPRVERVVAALAAIYRPTIASALGRMAALGIDRRRFEVADRAMFPVQYGNGESEAGRIDILRVSPLDCRTLAEESPDAPPKLAGTGLGHFSGFFKDIWRAQDILWGRLDGAERLVCTILPDDTFARRALILQAQVAILSERDLDEVMEEIERGRPPEGATPPESRIEEMRRTLLVRALDRFAVWATTAQERGPDGKTAKVYDGHGLKDLFGPKGRGARLSAAERVRLLDKAWEGWA